ncbi:hypothetical protein C8R43DRAFT_942394 [Mycena crocata]|nr:hypothetical protein C8R43DRAFT_942394 [Mycena crocata]
MVGGFSSASASRRRTGSNFINPRKKDDSRLSTPKDNVRRARSSNSRLSATLSPSIFDRFQDMRTELASPTNPSRHCAYQHRSSEGSLPTLVSRRQIGTRSNPGPLPAPAAARSALPTLRQRHRPTLSPSPRPSTPKPALLTTHPAHRFPGYPPQGNNGEQHTPSTMRPQPMPAASTPTPFKRMRSQPTPANSTPTRFETVPRR